MPHVVEFRANFSEFITSCNGGKGALKWPYCSIGSNVNDFHHLRCISKSSTPKPIAYQVQSRFPEVFWKKLENCLTNHHRVSGNLIVASPFPATNHSPLLRCRRSSPLGHGPKPSQVSHHSRCQWLGCTFEQIGSRSSA